MKHKILQPFSNVLALRLSISLSIFLNSILVVGYLYNSRVQQTLDFRLIYAFLSDIVLFYSLYSFCFRIIQKTKNNKSKFRTIIFGSIAIAILLNFTFTEISIHIFGSTLIPVNLLVIGNVMKDLIVLLIVLLSTSLFHSISERQLILLENEKLTADNIRIRYEVLKNQVDPHFLFNSLNTLDGLIGTDVNKAHEYVQSLSQVFRYSIGNKEIMYLDEELGFTESYAHLMKIRYGENLQIQYRIDDKYRNWYIMPISLQLLVENAIKHNVISTKYPLIIHIETTPADTIKVSNEMQLKNVAEDGEGIGLANLSERYDLLFHKEVLITMADIFCVEIPLIKELEDTTLKNKQDESSNNRRRACCDTKFAAIN